MTNINQQLQQAYEAIKAGRKQEGVNILLPILKADSDNANAWWLMAHALREPDDIRKALENVLRLRPDHDKAQQMLDKLNARYPREPQPPADEQAFDDDPFANEEYDPHYQQRLSRASSASVITVKRQTSAIGDGPKLEIVGLAVGVLLIAALGVYGLYNLREQVDRLINRSFVGYAFRQVGQAIGISGSATLGEYINRGTVSRGQTVQGTVDSFDDDGWIFNAEGGEQLTIELNARDRALDPQLYIYRPDGTLLAENDDIDLTANNFNSRLQVTLPTGGRYVIVVSAFNLGGPYELIVR
ncbi:MAG: pre-peptidase C-terminal domain-containing protein [Aggregatilineales bacterium]